MYKRLHVGWHHFVDEVLAQRSWGRSNAYRVLNITVIIWGRRFKSIQGLYLFCGHKQVRMYIHTQIYYQNTQIYYTCFTPSCFFIVKQYGQRISLRKPFLSQQCITIKHLLLVYLCEKSLVITLLCTLQISLLMFSHKARPL